VYSIILYFQNLAPFFLSLLCLHNKLRVSNFSLLSHFLFHLIHTNTSTQKNQHRDTQTHPHGQTNREREMGLDVVDRCLLVDKNGFWCIWIDADGVDRCWSVDRC